ncbi:MAG TPA: CoA-binding protein [Gemmatimonadales bacterium]|nr:CoA-binding protein [Gemmatimonadales bacterium]
MATSFTGSSGTAAPLADDEIARILREARRVAVIGLGDKPERPAYRVAWYLQRAGYDIAPVHPAVTETLGVPVYRSLAEAHAAAPVHIVDVFRRSEAVPELVPECVAIAPLLVWLQVGVTSDMARTTLGAAGIPFVQDRCLAVAHAQLVGR